jgi:cytochrome c-type biogenesis protein
MTTNEISFFTPLLAIVFGLLSFASPCCLPLLPAYVGMIAGSSGSVGTAGAGRRGRGCAWTASTGS